MNNWYSIPNIDNFIKKIRKFSFDKFIEINNSNDENIIKLNAKNDVDSLITIEETKNIIMPMIKTNKQGHKISEKKIYKIVERLNSRMISNSLSSMVSDGILESAFDSELNDFVFWEKNNDNAN